MKVKPRQCGLTLMEMTVVIAVMALLAVFGLPAIRALVNSFESEGGAKAMISASLASARAIAAKEHHYAGIRFQKAYDPNDPDLLNAPQYMIFIVHDPAPKPKGTDLANGFRAVEGINPIRLPDSVAVMDLRIGSDEIDLNEEIDGQKELTDTTTFSIVFSPSGKLVIHQVRAINKIGQNNGTRRDDIFNTVFYINNGIGMFVQDDNADQEPSRRSFIIYDKSEFNKVDKNRRWSDYLKYLELIYINPYTGTMINR